MNDVAREASASCVFPCCFFAGPCPVRTPCALHAPLNVCSGCFCCKRLNALPQLQQHLAWSYCTSNDIWCSTIQLMSRPCVPKGLSLHHVLLDRDHNCYMLSRCLQHDPLISQHCRMFKCHVSQTLRLQPLQHVQASAQPHAARALRSSSRSGRCPRPGGRGPCPPSAAGASHWCPTRART